MSLAAAFGTCIGSILIDGQLIGRLNSVEDNFFIYYFEKGQFISCSLVRLYPFNFPVMLRQNFTYSICSASKSLQCAFGESREPKMVPNSFMQVIFRAAFWIRSWAIPSKEEERNSLKRDAKVLKSKSWKLSVRWDGTS